MPQRPTNTTTRRLLGAALTLAALYPAASFVDALGHGPYTTWFNERCLEQSEAAGLIGTDAAAVRDVLGDPTSVWDDDPRVVTMNYAPHAWLPHAKFQVHLRDGRVVGLETFDD